MKLKILWMYHDLMDLYGDKGNIQVLKTRAAKRGIDVTVDTCTIDEKRTPADYDLFFLGGGADHEQSLIKNDLLKRRDAIREAYDSGSAFLLICGGYQLFGAYYKDQDGHLDEGLHFFDYYTEASDRSHRCIGNIAVEASIDGETFPAVGFENHGGQTRNVDTVFARVLKGHGNTFDGGTEGFVNDQVLATYMHGPLLPKNPRIADALLRRALRRNYGSVDLEPLDDTLEEKAQEVMFRRMHVRINHEEEGK
ncbi:MAG: glutamine amidotransferase [Galactobacillus timonensis]|uniref:type 1 glutamine amidotransferase n=1 Tax=Galactobacillus timonensis TaxID=2041840 RepID=UPI0023F43F11|nr:glutamine amidotransferase [Galactobacillus timonensis]MDY5223381.1 glutamine amidotransferase [Lachnospiraceae bacterium]MCI6068486.1 glutamine amidotransferase [Galactobacillus timonensis]MCI6753779.1 glutamine amidotransferase [Galactobacillus timonensis]MDD6600153.1 glutamine amidotransferase [Galactobacillus timonensis]MDD7087384.1 glutamine amidotransferase [Galactobacillus timonensis]